jgi:hypothetical protein
VAQQNLTDFPMDKKLVSQQTKSAKSGLSDFGTSAFIYVFI